MRSLHFPQLAHFFVLHLLHCLIYSSALLSPLPCLSSIVSPIWQALCKTLGNYCFFLHAVALLKLITDSPLVALLMRDKMRPRQRENEQEAVRANKILAVQTGVQAVIVKKRVTQFCKTIYFQHKVRFH